MGGIFNPIPDLRRKMLLGKEERKNEQRTEQGAESPKQGLHSLCFEIGSIRLYQIDENL